MTRFDRLVLLVAASATIAATVPAEAAGARFTPPSRTVTVAAGRTADAGFTFESVARPARPLDVYLLVDATGSMRPKPVGDHLATAVRRLAAAHPDMHVGLGEFRTYHHSDWTKQLTYRRLLGMGRVTPTTYSTITALRADSAAGDEAHTLALVQAVRGDGHTPYVAAGHEAGFRPGARKLVVMVTDEGVTRDSAPVGTMLDPPTIDDAVDTLSSAGVEFVGLSLARRRALEDLEELASRTSTRLARDVECGTARAPQRVRAGTAAACQPELSRLADVLVAMVGALGTRLTFTDTTASGNAVVTPAERWIDPTRPYRTAVKVAATCEDSSPYAVKLAAKLAGTTLATATLDVRCRG